jgi:hypothetical protein
MAILKDGSTGNTVKINDENQMHVFSVTSSVAEDSAIAGTAWNFNTGDIVTTGDATLLYLKNTTSNNFIIDAIACGLSDGITFTDKPYLTFWKGVTGGDLVTDATPVLMNENRNFGYTDTFSGDVFTGKVGGTVTGGTQVAQHMIGAGRSFASLGFAIPPQASFAMTLTLNGTGTANMYSVIIGHFHHH